MKKRFMTICMILLILCVMPSQIFASEKPLTSAKACVVMEANSGRLLYHKNKDAKLPEASTTKIMTALVVAENTDINKTVTIPKEAVGIEGSSIYLREGEKLTIKELLYGLMLRSGNDCAVALALSVGGSIQNFANMMNQKAIELGCKNTNFTNPHGLPDDKHYTSAYDLGLISCAAINNEIIREVVSSKYAKISNDGYDYDRYLANKNKILSKFDGANGVKTGFTKKAGRCFVGSACRDGMQLVVVLLNCGPMFEDSMSLMDKYFAEYEMKQILSVADVYDTLIVDKGKQSFVSTKVQNFFAYPLKKDGSEDNLVKVTKDLQKSVCAPVKAGQKVGKIEISFDNQLIFSSNICTLNAVKKVAKLNGLLPMEKNTDDKIEQIYGRLWC